MKVQFFVIATFKIIVTITIILLTLSVPLGAQTFDDAYADYQAQNYGSAFKKLKVLAKQNNEMAQGLLGYMYLNGEGTIKNGREAVKWYKKSATADFYFAHSEIGRLYQSGDFVPQSLAKAGFHYKRCADIIGNNDKNGLCHQKTAFALQNDWLGDGRDFEAQKYHKKAFQLGGSGFYMMSLLMSMKGNKTESLMWWNICAAYKPDCKDAKNEAFAKATQSERSNAQKMSNDCVDSNFENCGWTN